MHRDHEGGRFETTPPCARSVFGSSASSDSSKLPANMSSSSKACCISSKTNTPLSQTCDALHNGERRLPQCRQLAKTLNPKSELCATALELTIERPAWAIKPTSRHSGKTSICDTKSIYCVPSLSSSSLSAGEFAELLSGSVTEAGTGTDNIHSQSCKQRGAANNANGEQAQAINQHSAQSLHSSLPSMPHMLPACRDSLCSIKQGMLLLPILFQG